MNVGAFDEVSFSFPNDTISVSRARRAVREHLEVLGLDALVATAELVTSELVANAVLHTDGPIQVEVRPAEGGVRISVFDTSALYPVIPSPSPGSMTGRGLLMVRSLAVRFGFDPAPTGKVVWANLRAERLPGDTGMDELIDAWADDLLPPAPTGTYHIELGEVPTDLLLEAKSHVDNLVREFILASSGAEAGTTSTVPPHLAELIETVVNGFAPARLSIKRQALDAYQRGLGHLHLKLDLPLDAIGAGEEYLAALDQADMYCRAARLLTLETPPKHRVFRHWYVGEIVRQLRELQAGRVPGPPETFEHRLLEEIDTVAAARSSAERAARLYVVSSALAGALTPETVAHTVLTEGAAALGASGGGLLLPAGPDGLQVPATVGYDEQLVERLRRESARAELPAAVALRTGEPVWLESRAERDVRFPELAEMEGDTVSICAVPLAIGPRRLGAIRFSFSQPRIFDADERRFVMALAAQAAQALDRAAAYTERSQLANRLQRSLLPPALPDIPGVDLGAVYHPLGSGMEIGGDFYDVWPLGSSQWAFALGDVCGTGPEAAAMTAMVRFSLRALTTTGSDPSRILHRLNTVLCDAAPEGAERFCTVIFGMIDTAGGPASLTIATGGHPEPVIRRGDGATEIVPVHGSLLGALPEVRIGQVQLEMGPGDQLVLYTDGATEARSDGPMFGLEGVRDVVAREHGSAAATAAAIEAAVIAHRGGELVDDTAVLVVGIGPSGV